MMYLVIIGHAVVEENSEHVLVVLYLSLHRERLVP
jgi:hypothetical protein